MKDLWSDAEYDTAKGMWRQGATASEVSRALPGRSRNAVIGVLHRRGETRDPEITLGNVQRVNRMRRNGSFHNKPPKPKPSQRPQARHLCPTPPKEPHRPPVETLAPTTTLMAVRDGECRWPIGDPQDPDFGLCGRLITEREDGSPLPYCKLHAFGQGGAYQAEQPKNAATKLVRSVRRYL